MLMRVDDVEERNLYLVGKVKEITAENTALWDKNDRLQAQIRFTDQHNTHLIARLNDLEKESKPSRGNESKRPRVA